MSMLLKIVSLTIVFAAVLAGGAVVKNQVPLTDPPGLVKRLAIYLTRNSARTRADHELPELRSRAYALPPQRVFELAVQAAQDAGWRIVDRDAGGRNLRVVASTPWLRFKDDIHIALGEAPEGGTATAIESRSRVGRADFGANIAHIIELHRRLDALAG